MKILTINTKYNEGGAAKIANNIHNYINNNTDNNSLFVYARNNCSDETYKKIQTELLKYTYATYFRIFGKDKSVNLNNIYNDIDTADIVHIHNLHGYYINYKQIIEYLIKKDKKIVWTLHDTWILTGRCAVPNRCEKWREGCRECNDRNIYPKSIRKNYNKELLYKKNLINRINPENIIFVTPSKWLKDVIKSSYLNKFNVVSIGNGINKRVINKNYDQLRNDLGLPMDKKIILFVSGNMNDELKGIKFIKYIIENIDRDDILFVSIGNVNKSLKFDNLFQFGYINDEEKMSQIYKIADLFVNPSMGETFSLTTAEALSQGTKVVAFDIGPAKELINNSNGVLVEPFNEKMLLEVVESQVDINDYKIFDINNINSEDDMCKKYMDIYYELLHKK